MVSYRLSIKIGFSVKAFIPAAIAAERSISLAFAETAIMGIRDFTGWSICLIRLVASIPSIFGMDKSIRIISKYPSGVFSSFLRHTAPSSANYGYPMRNSWRLPQMSKMLNGIMLCLMMASEVETHGKELPQSLGILRCIGGNLLKKRPT